MVKSIIYFERAAACPVWYTLCRRSLSVYGICRDNNNKRRDTLYTGCFFFSNKSDFNRIVSIEQIILLSSDVGR